jgi:SAM-dependent methyltransferase
VELAERLRRAPAATRRELYGRVYDELFRRVPDHPQLARRADAAWQDEHARVEVDLIRQFMPPGGSYIELGAGDCATARRMAAHAAKVTVVEVSAEIVPADLPPTVDVVLSDGVSVPVPAATADVVYSNQLMEHLHPDDAAEQLRNVAQALRRGGRYICITPNRISGPHDISSSFDAVARGFHLKEYTYRELAVLLRRAGFRRVRAYQQLHGRTLSRAARMLGGLDRWPGRVLQRAGKRAIVLPLAPFLVLERVVAISPRRLGRLGPIKRLLGIHVVAER